MKQNDFIESFDFIVFINECINACNKVLVDFPHYNALRLQRKFYFELKKGYIKKGFQKMDKIRIYTLKNEDGVLLPYFMTSTNDKDIKDFSLDYYKKTVESVEKPQEKINMLEQLRKCSFCCIGEVDLYTGGINPVNLTLYTLSEFMKEVKPDIEIKEGENGQYEMAYNVSE